MRDGWEDVSQKYSDAKVGKQIGDVRALCLLWLIEVLDQLSDSHVASARCEAGESAVNNRFNGFA